MICLQPQEILIVVLDYQFLTSWIQNLLENQLIILYYLLVVLVVLVVVFVVLVSTVRKEAVDVFRCNGRCNDGRCNGGRCFYFYNNLL